MYRGQGLPSTVVRAPGLPRVETSRSVVRAPSAEAFQAVKSCAMRLRTREHRPRTLSVVAICLADRLRARR